MSENLAPVPSVDSVLIARRLFRPTRIQRHAALLVQGGVVVVALLVLLAERVDLLLVLRARLRVVARSVAVHVRVGAEMVVVVVVIVEVLLLLLLLERAGAPMDPDRRGDLGGVRGARDEESAGDRVGGVGRRRAARAGSGARVAGQLLAVELLLALVQVDCELGRVGARRTGEVVLLERRVAVGGRVVGARRHTGLLVELVLAGGALCRRVVVLLLVRVVVHELRVCARGVAATCLIVRLLVQRLCTVWCRVRIVVRGGCGCGGRRRCSRSQVLLIAGCSGRGRGHCARARRVAAC